MKTNPMTRTLVFAGTAVLATVLALAANHLTKPARIDGDSDFGKDFFADFTDARKATSMRVVSFEEETAAARIFAVEYKDGWKIPSYHDYPADGKDQLAKAAASVIGLKRGSLVTRRKTDHERYGVIDPLDDANPATKGRGTRITISENDVALADLIVGNKDHDGDKRYVRKVGEDKVYLVSAKFDVSTKFADWAETDLLKVSGFDIIRLRGSRPKFNAADEYEGDDVFELSREKSGDPWKLADLDEATEELKTDDISTMINTLDDLRLVGVRPRPSFQGKPLLNADLKVELPKQLLDDPQVKTEIIRVLRSDLGEKGFKVGQDESGQTQLVSREGELTAGTKDGVVYRLTFGSVFTGTEEEIAIGSKSDSKKDESATEKKDSKDDGKKSRYLIVRVNFDESLLGPPPTEPVAPTPPPGVEPPADDKKDESKKDADAKKDDASKSVESPKKETEKKSEDDKKPATDSDSKTEDSAESQDDEEGEESTKKEEKPDEKKPDADKPDTAKPETPKDEKPKADEKPADSKPDATKPDETKPEESKKDLKAEYLEALKRYDAEKGRYVSDLAAHKAKIESGKKTVADLNQRFADWYYVISNDSFEKLRLSRATLIKVKDAPAAKPDESKTDDQKPADEKKASPDGDDNPKKPAANDDTKKPESKDDAPAIKDEKPAVKDEQKASDASTESK